MAALLTAVLFGVSLATAPAAMAASALGGWKDETELRLLELVNEQRAELELDELERPDDLHGAAREWVR